MDELRVEVLYDGDDASQLGNQRPAARQDLGDRDPSEIAQVDALDEAGALYAELVADLLRVRVRVGVSVRVRFGV